MPAGPQCSEEKIGDNILLTLYTQTHKMVKHTQTIRRLLLTNCYRVFDHFVGLAFKDLNDIAEQPPAKNVIPNRLKPQSIQLMCSLITTEPTLISHQALIKLF